jgi:hypothetical protein
MLMATVVHPEAFDETHFADPRYHLNTEVLLRGIDSNGLVLLDTEERLYQTLCDSVEPLARLGKGKNTHALFEELLKKHRQKIVHFVKTRCSVNRNVQITDVVTQVARQCKADALVVASVNHSSVIAAALPNTPVISVPDYISSPVENKRRLWCERLPPVDQMPLEFDALIERCTRYSCWLRFFDKQIGKGNSLSHFRRGIERILRLWLNAAHFPQDNLHAELFTVVDDSSYAKLSPDVAYRRVKDNLIQSLERDLGLRIELHFKHDVNSICHARHLQTQSLAISFDAGFDFINEDGTLRRNFIRIDGGCLEHLQEYRKLPNYNPPT